MSEMHRVPITGLRGGVLEDAAAVRHVGRVLRLGPGKEFLAYDGTHELHLRIQGIEKNAVRVSELARRALEPVADITVAQCLIKGRRWDTFLEKVTELGVARILPVLSEHTVARAPAGQLEQRLARWHKLARAAAAQCAGRTPVILDPAPLPMALDRLSTARHKIMLCLTQDAVPLGQALDAGAGGSVALLLGPEGDFTTAECETAKRAGFRAAHLGPRILRSETAAVAAVALALHIMGALERPLKNT